jgi:small-conductance mechanosensitive channel
MGFWETTFQFFWQEESLPVLVLALSIAFLLFHFRPEERKSVLNTLTFFFICLFLQFLSSLIHALEFHTAAAVLYETAIVGAGIAVIRLWGLLLFRIMLPMVRLSPPRIAEDVFVIIAYIGWGLVRLRYAGLDLGSIVATSAMITAVVAFAMQDTLGNILGGLALQLDNSIEIGDWIEVDGVAGRVADIRWRSTLVETRNWETVVFPNSQLMKGKFIVLGRRTNEKVKWRRWVWFNVALGVPPEKVAKAVENAINHAKIKHVAKKPAPNCVLMEMDKGCARYALRYWLTDLAVDDPTDGIMRWHIYTALERAGIKLKVEEQRIHLVKVNEHYEELLHQREMLLRIKTLKKVKLFTQMTEDELQKIAEHLKYEPFAKGDIIATQGAVTQHWLHIIIKGRAEVYLEGESGERRSLNVLSKGEFFGEMSLMMGIPRVASVVAKTNVECYRLDKTAFEEIMRNRPTIAEEVTHILVERKTELDQAHQSLDKAAKHHDINHHRHEVLATVKHFFGL